MNPRVPPGWDFSYGSGILDATQVLEEALPDPDQVTRAYDWQWDRMTNAVVLLQCIFEHIEGAKEAVEQMVSNSEMSFDDFMKNHGVELNRALMESPDSWQRVADAAAVIVANSSGTAHDAVQDAVNTVATQCSNTLNAVAGWLGV
jgi:hypothetical protein